MNYHASNSNYFIKLLETAIEVPFHHSKLLQKLHFQISFYSKIHSHCQCKPLLIKIRSSTTQKPVRIWCARNTKAQFYCPRKSPKLVPIYSVANIGRSRNDGSFSAHRQ